MPPAGKPSLLIGGLFHKNMLTSGCPFQSAALCHAGSGAKYSGEKEALTTSPPRQFTVSALPLDRCLRSVLLIGIGICSYFPSFLKITALHAKTGARLRRRRSAKTSNSIWTWALPISGRAQSLRCGSKTLRTHGFSLPGACLPLISCPSRNRGIGYRSRHAKNLPAGIWLIFRG